MLALISRRGQGVSRAAATRASKSRASSPTSGCHCTARRNRAAGVLDTPRGPRRPPTPRAGSRVGEHALVVVRGTSTCRTERSRPAASPGRAHLVRAVDPGAAECSSWPAPSGRCCSSTPPAATAITCMPRQMPSNGRSALGVAAATSASSRASRSGRGACTLGCGVGAVARGVDVGPAGEDQAVEPVEQLVGQRLVGVRPARRRHDSEPAPAASTCRRSRAAPAPPARRATPPRRPARRRS